VRDRGGELTERGELLTLRHPGPRRADRLALRPDDDGRVPLAVPGLDGPADEVAEEGERGPEEPGHEQGDVAAVHLEGHPEPDEARDVDGPEEGAARGAPPPYPSKGLAALHVVDSLATRGP